MRSDILDKILRCDFKNDCRPLGIYSNTQKRLIDFNIWKQNIALLPCYKNDITLIEASNDNPNYFDKMATNTPTACQRFCQVYRGNCFFTYHSKINYCWFFNDRLIFAERQFNGKGYISGPKYCGTPYPVSKGGFKIQVHSPFLYIQGANATLISFDSPTLHTYTLDNYREIC